MDVALNKHAANNTAMVQKQHSEDVISQFLWSKTTKCNKYNNNTKKITTKCNKYNNNTKKNNCKCL